MIQDFGYHIQEIRYINFAFAARNGNRLDRLLNGDTDFHDPVIIGTF
jgi:hypothetical protein